MKQYLPSFLVMFLCCPQIKAQFSIGYGAAYFPSDMSRFYAEEAFFKNSSFQESYFGSLTKTKMFLPVHIYKQFQPVLCSAVQHLLNMALKDN
jgi:hypothetical protein